MDKLINVITKTGFEIDIPEDILDDAELFEYIIDIDKQDFTHLIDVIRSIFGEEGKKELYDHLRDKNGRVKLTDVASELGDVFAELSKQSESKKK